MRQAQGLEPSNPYQTLQLHPAAPRELIDEAYWTLVERVRATKASSASESALSALNGAYAALSNADRRQGVDRALSSRQMRPPMLKLRRSGIWPLAGTKFTADHTDLYHLLRVDCGADSEIIAVAYRVLAAQASGLGAETAFLRRLLRDAYQVLAEPVRRATYDMSIGIGKPPADAPAAPAAEQAELVEEQEPPAPDSAAPSVPNGDAGAAGERELIAEATVPPEHLRVDPEPAPAATAAPAAVEEPEGEATERISVPAAPASHRGRKLMGALRGVVATARIARSDTQTRVPRKEALAADAEQRLLTLQDGHGDAGTPPADASHPDYGAAIAGAELVFIDGPRAGARVSLGHEAVTLGSAHAADVMLSDDMGAIAAQHVRIWQHGDRFVLRQIADNGTLVGGEAPALRLVMLDDGDEIQIGVHRMRFSLTG